MSEPMSAVEIEDVLSSIRRLVSDELRPSRRPDAAQAGDRLILTQALRVVAPVDEAEAPFAALTEDAPLAAPDMSSRDDVANDLSQTIGLLAGAMAGAPAFESETGDPAPEALPAPGTERLTLTLPAGFDTDDSDTDPAEPEAATWDGSGLAPGPADLLVFRSRQHEAPPLDEPDILPPAAPSPAPAWPGEGADGSAAEVFARVVAEVLEEEVGSFAPAVPDWPDQRETEDPAAPAWEEEAVMDDLADLERELADITGAPATAPATAATDLPLPTAPEALREIVRQMIREELQGTLGERITRNVRKLVRAEIARAMTLHDLD